MNSIEESAELGVVFQGQASTEEACEDKFHTSDIVTIAAAHAAHDTYFSYLPTVLPLLIQNLSLNTTQAGFLSAFSQIPNLIQPFIGYLADHKNLKLLVILAPALSGMLITLVGIAPSFGMVALLLILAGFSTASFHAVAPGMVSGRTGSRVGRGMGFFMVGGELGYAFGPVIVVAAIGLLTLRGLPWLMILGIFASVILFFRLKDVSTIRHTTSQNSTPVKEALLEMKGIMLPIMVSNFITGFLAANIVTYLPTFMSSEGAAFFLAGVSLTIVGIGGTLGVLLMGLISDHVGQRTIAVWGTLASAVFALLFLFTTGWVQILALFFTGMSAFMSNPAFLAIIQAHFKEHRSLANGVYMSSNFVLKSVVVVIVGVLADQFGLRMVFVGSAFSALLAIPLIATLPQR